MLISLNQPYEVRYWSKKFKVTPAKLKAAVKSVGHSSHKVEGYLMKSKKAVVKKTKSKKAKKTKRA